MKILTAFFKALFSMIVTAFSFALIIFILLIIVPSRVIQAFEIIKGLI